MAAALESGRIAPAAVGYVNAHGTATPQNDRIEARAIHEVFAPGRLLVSSTKSMIGHTMAAAGALEAVATILALVHEVVPPTANLETPDPDVAFDCVPRVAREAAVEYAISNSFGFGLVIGAEFGELRSTIAFVDGYLHRGPGGLSALLFPNTVMNTMAAATAIAVTARELSLTLNAPTVAGELAIARAAAAVRAGRADAVLAGGVDEFDSALAELLAEGGAPSERRGEGAGFVLLESLDTAEARGARVLGEIAGVAWRALRARPYGVGRGAASRAVAAALDEAGATSGEVGRVWVSASGDGPRDRWEQAILEEALRPARPPQTARACRAGRHAGLGALAVAAAALDEVSRGPAVVHAIARGGTHVAL